MRNSKLLAGFLICALGSALFTAPAFATIGTPVDLGAIAQATSVGTTVALTTGATCAAGSDVVVLETTNNNAGATGVSDGASYTSVTASAQTAAGTMQLWWRTLGSALASGATITATYSGTSGPRTVHALCVSGLAASPVDVASVSAKVVANSTPSVSTGALVQSKELLLGYLLVLSGQSDSLTPNSGWTQLTPAAASTSYEGRWAYQIVNSTASVAWAPTLSTGRTTNIAVSSFKDTDSSGPVAAAQAGRRALLGVGM